MDEANPDILRQSAVKRKRENLTKLPTSAKSISSQPEGCGRSYLDLVINRFSRCRCF